MPVEKHPRISAVVLSCNNEDRLYQSLDSVLAQDYPNIELLVSDDCSSTFDKAKVEKYINARKASNIVRVLVNQTSTKVGAVKNLELVRRMEQGEIEIPITADDRWADEKVFSDFVARFEELGADAEWIVSQVELRDESAEDAKSLFIADEALDCIRNGDMESLLELELQKNTLPGTGSAFRKSFFSKTGTLSDDYKLIGDYPSYVRWLRNGHSVYLLDRVTAHHSNCGTAHHSRQKRRRIQVSYFWDLCLVYALEVLPHKERFSPDAYESAEKRYCRIRRLLHRMIGRSSMSKEGIMQLKNSSILFPLVSVLLVTYNQEQFVKESLDSILIQDYPNIELVIADDCSSDNTDKMIRSWIRALPKNALVNVEYLKGEVNLGICGNLNMGLAAVQGKYVKPLAGDDILAEKYISSMLLKMDTENADIAFSRECVFVDELPEDKSGLEVRPSKAGEKLFSLPPEEAYQELIKACYFPAPTAMLKTDSLRALGGYDMTYPCMEDYPLWIKAHQSGMSFTYVPMELLYYRVSSRSISNRQNTEKTPYQIAFHNGLLRITDTVRLPEALKYNIPLHSLSVMYDCNTHELSYDDVDNQPCSGKTSVLILDTGDMEQLKLTVDSIARQCNVNVQLALSMLSSYDETELNKLLADSGFSKTAIVQRAQPDESIMSRLRSLVLGTDGSCVIWLNGGDTLIRADALRFCHNALNELRDNEYAISNTAFFVKENQSVDVIPTKGFNNFLINNSPLTRIGNILVNICGYLPVFAVKRELFEMSDLLGGDDLCEYPERLFLWRLCKAGYRCVPSDITIAKKTAPVQSNESIVYFFENEVFPVIGSFPRNIATICANTYAKALKAMRFKSEFNPHRGWINSLLPIPGARAATKVIYREHSIMFTLTRIKNILRIFLLGLILVTVGSALSIFDIPHIIPYAFWCEGALFVCASILLFAYKSFGPLKKLIAKKIKK